MQNAHDPSLLLPRFQFAFTVGVHMIFPAFSIGLAAHLAVLDGVRLTAGRQVFLDLYRYWIKTLSIIFNPSFIFRLVHVELAAFLSVACPIWLASWDLVRQHRHILYWTFVAPFSGTQMRTVSRITVERAGKMPETPIIFESERDFAGSLRCIPMIARQKLDIVGIKITLRQWSRLTREEHGSLVDRACKTIPEQDAYRPPAEELIAMRPDEPARFLAVQGLEDWREKDRMPEMALTQAEANGVSAPTSEQWADLIGASLLHFLVPR